jgi:hypothetical protein
MSQSFNVKTITLPRKQRGAVKDSPYSPVAFKGPVGLGLRLFSA